VRVVCDDALSSPHLGAHQEGTRWRGPGYPAARLTTHTSRWIRSSGMGGPGG
jgi:hypothetical protein